MSSILKTKNKSFKAFAVIAFAALILMVSCGSNIFSKKEKTYLVLIETAYGDMKVKLYNETPLHRDNFLKLTKEEFYDSLLFHRVIKDFMIQGGDPKSKGASSKAMLGEGGPGYQIDAEIVQGLYHKKGALAAARQGDNTNPEKKSSGSQFYIVQGKVVPKDQMVQMTDKINFPILKKLVFDYVEQPENADVKQTIDSLKRARDSYGINKEYERISQSLDSVFKAHEDYFSYTDEQLEVYSTLGGTPHLDNNYTVFGEIIEGLNVIDSIAAVKTGKANRPVEDIIMNIKVIRK